MASQHQSKKTLRFRAKVKSNVINFNLLTQCTRLENMITYVAYSEQLQSFQYGLLRFASQNIGLEDPYGL